MIVVQLLGGLGNQMFQYACGRALALRTGKKLYLDLRHYAVDSQRFYELDKLNIQATGIIRSMDEMQQIGLSLGIERLSIWKERHFNFDPAVIALHDNVILAEGYWQSEKYFQDFSENICDELSPSLEQLSSESLRMGIRMRKYPAVAVHVRRGDYIQKSTSHGILSMDYYRRAISYIGQRVADARFYIFSDDADWCKQQFATLPNSQVVDHTCGKGSQEDLWLMSQCNHNIIANSTYSWWGAWLNTNPNKIVVTPERWFAGLVNDTPDLRLESWITLSAGDEKPFTPKVSICIPAFQQPNLLRRCLQSVQVQSFKNYEVIVTDDSADDCLKSVIEEFTTRIPITYIKNTKNMGSPANWNHGMQNASGEYIKILHHDDWFLDENSLADFVEMLEKNPEVNLAFCSSRHYKSGVHISSHAPTLEQLNFLFADEKNLLIGNLIGAPSAVIFRRCGLLFDNNLKWVVDIDFYIRLLSLNKNFTYTKKELICIDSLNETKVTLLCENNKKLELFEYFYLFDKINVAHFSEPFVNFFVGMFLKYDVRSLQEIRECGYEGVIDSRFEQILQIKEKIVREHMLGNKHF